MTTLPIKRVALAISVASALVLAGCSSEDKDPVPVSKTPTPVSDAASTVINGGVPNPLGGFLSSITLEGTAPTYALFSPLESIIPMPSDILFAKAATTDGTASTTPGNPATNAINDLDGWSTSAQVTIKFSGSLDPATVKGPPTAPPSGLSPQNVYLVVLNTGTGDALNPASVVATAPFDVAATTALQGAYTVSTVSIDGGVNNAIRISPTRPLLAKRKYLVVVSNANSASLIRDVNGAAVGASASYSYYGDLTVPTLPASNPTAGVQTFVRGVEQLASCWISITGGGNCATTNGAYPVPAARAGLVISNTFTTTDPRSPLVAMAAPRAAWFQTIFGQTGSAAAAATAVNNLEAAGLLPTPRARSVTFPTPVLFTGTNVGNEFDLSTFSTSLAAGKARLYTGALTLPIYNGTPSNISSGSAAATDGSFVSKQWAADTALASAASGGAVSVPADDDGTFNVTYRYPFAAKQASLRVPVQVTLPTSAMCAGAYPNDQFPVVIYVHGITSDRTSVIALAHSLADKACIATVAIDLPTHGVPANSSAAQLLNIERGMIAATADAAAVERHFEFIMNTSTGMPAKMQFGLATDSPLYPAQGSGQWFINLANLQNTRDNLKQAVMDLLNLNATLGLIDADRDGKADFNTGRVSVVGVSLGGIVATTFVNVNQAAIAGDMATGFTPRLNSVDAMAISVAGGSLPKILENSPSFAPSVLGGLAAAGVTQGTSNFENFLYVAQSTVDSADPINFAQSLDTNVPVLVQEIVGGGSAAALGDTKTYVKDKVVPNNAFPAGYNAALPAPLVGTDPLASLLGAVAPSAGPGLKDASGTPLLLRMTIGHHASLLRPNESGSAAPVNGEYLATVEMQTQVVSFVANPAATAVGTGTLPGAPTNVACGFVVGCVP